MPFAFFLIPAGAAPAVAADMNAFLASHKVMRVSREWCVEQGMGAWAFCVEHQGPAAGTGLGPGREGVREARADYKALLPPEQFAKFTQLRDARLMLAAKHNVASFVVFTNDQLFQMVRRGCRTLDEVKQIHGVGEERLTKYAPEMLRILNVGREGEGTATSGGKEGDA